MPHYSICVPPKIPSRRTKNSTSVLFCVVETQDLEQQHTRRPSAYRYGFGEGLTFFTRTHTRRILGQNPCASLYSFFHNDDVDLPPHHCSASTWHLLFPALLTGARHAHSCHQVITTKHHASAVSLSTLASYPGPLVIRSLARLCPRQWHVMTTTACKSNMQK
ncbi:hypothetical protein BDN70DRAFT_111290 [Pholiota conissans]|uniref:Uncharacterized protein n=1 Tax=Pholiota conissans TaxID=109636 RepID=A0A9P5YXP1_9AGAR|nr:hypothetical protein BDN70DRAFT_111290 [Pholiota conissans]